MFRLVFLALCLFIGTLVHADEIDTMLQQAHDKRSADIPEFVRLLGELESRASELTRYQNDFLSYLKTYYLSLTGEFKQGIVDYKQLIDSTSFDDIKFRGLYSLVNNYGVDRDFYNGSIYLKKLFELRPKITDQALIDMGDTMAALFYNESGQFPQALRQAELLLARETIPRTHCIAQYVVVNATLRSGGSYQGVSRVDQAIEVCSSISETIMNGFLNNIKAHLYLEQGNSAAAYGVLKANEAALVATQYPRIVASFYAIKAEVELALQMLEGAKKHAQLALEFSETATFSEPAVEAYRVLYEIAQQENDVDLALDYYVKFAETDKAYLDELSLRQIAVQQADHDAEVNRQQLVLVSQQNELLSIETQVAKKNAEKNLIALILISIILVLVCLWAYKSHRLHREMRTLAETDGLTGLNNRRQFYIEAQNALEDCKKSNQAISLMILDLDFFKVINDTYGHIVGDWALRRVAQTLHELCRKNDVVGRLGGEEFGVLLPGCNQDKALQVAESCRQAIADIDTSDSGFKFEITASLGVAECVSGEYLFDTLFSQSDTALYRSKSEGRNRVFAYANINSQPA